MAAGVVILVCLIQWAAGVEPVAGQIAVPLVIYATAAYGPAWASRTVLLAGLLGGVMLTTRLFSTTAESGILGLTIGALYTVLIWMLVLVSWTLGDLTRVRRLQLQALEDRTRRLEVEQMQERKLAAADERSHIAREMHDIVAHSLSVIITQADGARYAAAAKPELATEALATIAATAGIRWARCEDCWAYSAPTTTPLPALNPGFPILTNSSSASAPQHCRWRSSKPVYPPAGPYQPGRNSRLIESSRKP